MGNFSAGYPVRVPTRARHSPSSQLVDDRAAVCPGAPIRVHHPTVLGACRLSIQWTKVRFQGYETVAVHVFVIVMPWVAQGGKEKRKPFGNLRKHLDTGHHAREHLPG